MKLCAEFPEQTSALAAHRALIDGGVQPDAIEIRSSYPLAEEAIPPHRTRPFHMRRNVKMCWFIGGICGFLIAAGTQMDWPQYTSGHQIIPLPTNMIIAYESAMITGLITTTIFFFLETKPFRHLAPHPAEDIPVARGNIALVVEGDEAVNTAKKLLDGKGARTIVTYALMFLIGMSALTGCTVRMRDQRSIRPQAVGLPGPDAEQQQPLGTVSMPTKAEQAIGAPPLFGYYNLNDMQRIENANPGMIPKQYIALKNPVPSTPQSVSRGKELYALNCAFCHGATGHGEGPVGQVFGPRPPALAEAATAALSDGAMFWKITVGPNTMPSFVNRLTPQERFDVINYIRTLEKGAAHS